jgi:thiamine pyrophosphokinase
MHTMVVVTGAGYLDPPPRPGLTEGATAIIAADGGLDLALHAGLAPTHLVGDLDSVTRAARAWADEHRVTVERHPTDKNATDTELALAAAIRLTPSDGPTALVVLAGTSCSESRPDHVLGILAALGHPRLGSFESIEGSLAGARIAVVHGGRTVHLPLDHGTVLSLLALHGDAAGVALDGCRWPLDDATITAHSTLGISNEALGPVTIACATGVVTVVIP